MTITSLFGALALISLILVSVCSVAAFAFTKRMRARPHVRLPLDIGTLPAVLRKVRDRQPLSEEELDLARQVLADRAAVTALAIPATLFFLGCFYVFGSLEQLDGHIPSERTFLGVIPMITSTNMAVQVLRSMRLKRRLPNPTPPRHNSQPITG